MALSDQTAHFPRVIPIHLSQSAVWQGGLLAHLLSNPRHMTWLMERPMIRHFVDEILLGRMIHDRAEQVVIYHSTWRFEVDFWLEGELHRVQIPNHRWALPIILRLKTLAGIDVARHTAPQRGEIPLAGGHDVAANHYPTPCSERIVLRPLQVNRLSAVA